MAKVTRLIPKLIKFEDIHEGVGSSYRTATAAYFRNRQVKAIYWPMEVETEDGYLDYYISFTFTPGVTENINVLIENRGNSIYSKSFSLTASPQNTFYINFQDKDVYDNFDIKVLSTRASTMLTYGNIEIKFNASTNRFEGEFVSGIIYPTEAVNNEEQEEIEEQEESNE